MILINNLLAIFRRELTSYLTSPLAYGITTVFWLISGFFFVSILLGPEGIIQQVSQREQMGVPVPPTDVAYQFIKFYFEFLGGIVLFILPVLSMALYTEERKRGTLELIATSPITNWVVAVGKLLAVLTFFITMIIPILGYEIFIFNAATPPVPPAVPLLAHAALILLAASVLALGMFISSLTESTIFAAILTFAVVLFLWITDLIANQVPGVFGNALEHISLISNYETLVQGLLDTNSLIVFASYILLGIFLTAQSVAVIRGDNS
ncbi:ABC transporter permease subunit [Euhalothece natronophila Z-M001]|uniref:ABC transporter permease subunit n=1 Tax=Euhalothece natronophila Z-M001 TaxID=522448 RepID=A0A5B8NIA1_9CHRO|nr:ABC transporter permease subunit [Euhalothece natronophila]QDZ38637.1 ABC transporter permease subunit [Euhalothece natronophila Z-M001]